MSAGAQHAVALALVGGFARCGVRHAFVSPGSRSSPLALAALAHPGVTTTVAIDERAAAFAALGAARVSGAPSVLIATSGTAGAHWLPAVLEADASRIPLLLLTADRPPELHLRGANQTMDQAHLFGGAARAFLDLDAGALAPDAARATAARATIVSLGPRPGPVHLNVRLRKPLEPPVESGVPENEGEEQAPRVTSARPEADPQSIARLAETIARAERPLFVAGPAPLDSRADAPRLAALARAAGAPILAEAASQLALRGSADDDVVCTPFDPLLRSPAWRTGARPDLVVQIGAPPISRGHAECAAAWRGVARIVLHDDPRADPWDAATWHVLADPARTADALAPLLSGRRTSDPWLATWRGASNALASRLAGLGANGRSPLCEAALVRETVGALGPTDLLALGNSLPVRDVDLFAPRGASVAGVLHQRGLSGIDGAVSGAAGAALAAQPGTRVVALIGDVAFAHDVGGLAVAAAAARPLVLVVIDNGGGRLFDLLPLGARDDLADARRALCTTPPDLDVEGAARAFGASVVTVRSEGEAAACLAEPRDGCLVVRAVVDGERTTELHGLADEFGAACAADALGRAAP